MSPFELVWNFNCRRLACDAPPVADRDIIWVRIEAIWNVLAQIQIQDLLD